MFAGEPLQKKREDMWTASLKENAKLSVCLGKSVPVHSIVFYNFACPSEEYTIGAKDVSIKLRNEEPISKRL